MNTQKDPHFTREEELRAENNVLKLKLQTEYGMRLDDTSALSPSMENQWLKSVYAFEQQFKDAKRTKLYDFIGRPAFTKADALTPAQITTELQRLNSVMEQNGVQLDCICQYDDTTIYRFLTEELFNQEMDDMRIPGMVCHFTYEEFHPNHDYDVRRNASEFLRALFTKSWSEPFDGMLLANKVSFGKKRYDRAAMSAIITAFQEAHGAMDVDEFNVTEVRIHPDLTKANVSGALLVTGKQRNGDPVRYEGACSFQLARKDEFWDIVELMVPGFTPPLT